MYKTSKFLSGDYELPRQGLEELALPDGGIRNKAPLSLDAFDSPPNGREPIRRHPRKTAYLPGPPHAEYKIECLQSYHKQKAMTKNF